MNFQRGLKRIFTVIAVCWVGFWVALAITNVPNNQQDPAHQLMEYAVTSIVPVVLAYAAYALLFIVVPWIGRGFKP